MVPRRALALCFVLAACGHHGPPERVPSGTWGGDNAALLVGLNEAHVHIDCTKGEIPGSIPLDPAGQFDVEGTYNVDAYPVDRGIYHPARFTGRLSGGSLTLSVRLTDTGQAFGPVALVFGQTPKMQACPICRR